MVSTVASSAASMASKASTARPCVWVEAGCTRRRAARRGMGQAGHPKIAGGVPARRQHAAARARAGPRRGSARQRGGSVQGAPAGAGGLALHAEDLQIRRPGGTVCGPTIIGCRPARLRAHTASQRSGTPVCCLAMSHGVCSGILCSALGSYSVCIRTSHFKAGCSTLPPSQQKLCHSTARTPAHAFSRARRSISLIFRRFVSKHRFGAGCHRPVPSWTGWTASDTLSVPASASHPRPEAPVRPPRRASASGHVANGSGYTQGSSRGWSPRGSGGHARQRACRVGHGDGPRHLEGYARPRAWSPLPAVRRPRGHQP